jgi:hypothetical protein
MRAKNGIHHLCFNNFSEKRRYNNALILLETVDINTRLESENTQQKCTIREMSFAKLLLEDKLMEVRTAMYDLEIVKANLEIDLADHSNDYSLVKSQ